MLEEWKRVANAPLKILDKAVWLIVVGTVLFLICYWKYIPEQVPMHWNALGVIDDYADAGGYIMLVIMMCFLLTWHMLAKILPNLTNDENLFGKELMKKATVEERTEVVRFILYMLFGCNLLSEILLAYITICGVLVRNLGAWFLPATGIAFLIIMAWFVWKQYQLKKEIRRRL